MQNCTGESNISFSGFCLIKSRNLHSFLTYTQSMICVCIFADVPICSDLQWINILLFLTFNICIIYLCFCYFSTFNITCTFINILALYGRYLHSYDVSDTFFIAAVLHYSSVSFCACGVSTCCCFFCFFLPLLNQVKMFEKQLSFANMY